LVCFSIAGLDVDTYLCRAQGVCGVGGSDTADKQPRDRRTPRRKP
jgi:hypothetical protein